MDEQTLEISAPIDNVIQPFELQSSNLRGRLVRVGSVLDDVLGPHGYPNPVAHLVAEMMTLSMLLSSMLKYDGIFTLQAQGDGPVSMLVADMISDGQVRGCATFDEERLQHAREQLSALKAEESAQNHLAQYLGKGHIVFTVDQGGPQGRYQGIVELKGSSLIDCVQHYFTQSEQIGTGIKMAVGEREGVDGKAEWRAGAIMLQHLPEDQKNFTAGLANAQDDDWRRSMIFLDTCTDDELLAPDLHGNDLLVRLFHEEGVKIYEPLSVEKGCRCSEERVKKALVTLPDDDWDYLRDGDDLRMTCEFCSTDYVFNFDEIYKEITQARS